MTNNPTYFALLEACQQPGCPVCRLAQDALERYLNSLFYESVNDAGVRRNLRKSRGFCHEHGWLILDKGLGDALGVAIIYHDILGTILERVPKTGATPQRRSRIPGRLQRLPRQLAEQLTAIRQILMPQERCPACLQRDSSTQIILSVLVESLTDSAIINEALVSSDGLCLPHLALALEKITNANELNVLLPICTDKLKNLDDDLAEYIRKSDYRFIQEGFGREGDSWRRAIRTTVGDNSHRTE